ncbi:MAG TPA: bifunctional nicotinamidase/pyrazinamidase [Amaricoccus sp.]|uniref:bifunctional nicotinamidase/pyrazinamidase n=1 Tax=Amaricoccus sp. TaxID=1872485 RepID=UPI002CF96DA9|nr:bifunctional nicotinamidase/pyrazinamidase [Amaricoccus sp.]HMQ93232.1 bifunctional nicotinamidase/pyrazinamidase [Amaricoccus sp.]HMR54255.1 bifunctional nicotinamidase/pyrazinamidase [Amaricoccus sp.]HMR62339.1 bifunctional nicotinamidase/pyrazinamidase [Amaricoccus sp.]HMU01241.1 bifunctional nicotinamidase/pyrazinamidase [Amaricoccus sp.]
MSPGDAGSALIVIDVQMDFCPGGALAVADGDAVVAPVNRILGRFPVRVLTQDWHPEGHLSFAANHPGAEPFSVMRMPYGDQVLWPVHCVQGSQGAAFHPGLETGPADLILRKGFRPEIDSYSAFFENDHVTPTGLAGYLRERGVTAVWLAGLATDFCVAYSALDAAALGFSVTLLEDACRGIDLDGSLEAARGRMQECGVAVARADDLVV